jgi:excisionase family DNA binding protein
MVADGMLGIEDAVQFADLGRTFLYAAMDRGDLAYVKCGRRRLIPKRALVEYLARGFTGRLTEPTSLNRTASRPNRPAARPQPQATVVEVAGVVPPRSEFA